MVMTNKITKKQMVILTRSGVEIWLDESKAIEFGEDWRRGMKAVVQLEGRYLNTVDITGIFTPQDLEDMKRRKNGEVLCKYGKWHPRNQECMCHITNRKNKLPEYLDLPKEKREENSRKFRAMKGDIFK